MKPHLKLVKCHRGKRAIASVRNLLAAPIKRGPLKGCAVAFNRNSRGQINTFRVTRTYALEFRQVIRIEAE